VYLVSVRLAVLILPLVGMSRVLLVVHILLGSLEGVVADMDPATIGEVDVGDGEKNQGN